MLFQFLLGAYLFLHSLSLDLRWPREVKWHDDLRLCPLCVTLGRQPGLSSPHVSQLQNRKASTIYSETVVGAQNHITRHGSTDLKSQLLGDRAESQVQDHPWLHREVMASLKCMQLCLTIKIKALCLCVHMMILQYILASTVILTNI